jgi:hypothetical protein
VISEKAIACLDIEIHDLIHGDLKSRMYDLEELIEGAAELDKAYYNGMLDGYTAIYQEIYRVIFAREDIKRGL